MALSHPVKPEQHHPGVHPLQDTRLSNGGVRVCLLVECQLAGVEGGEVSAKRDHLLAGEARELVVKELHWEFQLCVGIHHYQVGQWEDQVVERRQVKYVMLVSEEESRSGTSLEQGDPPEKNVGGLGWLVPNFY